MADSRMTPYNELTAAERKAMTQAEKIAYLKAARDEADAIAASKRAASNPMYDFSNRPDAPPPSSLPGENYIYYYSWIGDTNSGQWKLYRAPNNEENQAKYGSRAIGGTTQAKPGDPVGANALQTQPQPIKDANGNITGWEIPGKGSTSSSTNNTKKVIKTVSNPDGTTTVYYEDGTSKIINGLPISGNGNNNSTDSSGSGSGSKSLTGTTTGYGPGSTGYEDRKSAYDILFQEFSRYGLGSMVEPLKALITEGISPSEFGLRLTQTDAYKKRFAANQDRINKGLRALTPAEYIGLEDQYQSIMRNYGLPASYYTKGDLGTQEGFNKLLASDVSAAELEDRIATAQKRVLNTNPEVLQALKQFYPDLNNADILAYTLDPDKALSEIQRKVTAAEIGGAALAQGLQAQGGTAEALAGYGITKAQAQQGYQTIGEFLPTAQKLGDIYQNQGLGAYDQSTAEREVFGMQGAASAAQKRRKLAQLEQATFSGQAGTSQGALDRGRQGAI